MEIPLPNFQTLEKRIEQLAQEITRLRTRRHPENREVSTISQEEKEKIELKIKNIIKLLEDFEMSYL